MCSNTAKSLLPVLVGGDKLRFVMGFGELRFVGDFFHCGIIENRKPGKDAGAARYSVPFVPKPR